MTVKSVARTAALGLLTAGAVAVSTAPAQAQPYWGHPYGHRYWGPHPYWGPRAYGPYFWGGRHYVHRGWHCGYYHRCGWRYW